MLALKKADIEGRATIVRATARINRPVPSTLTFRMANQRSAGEPDRIPIRQPRCLRSPTHHSAD